MTEHRLFFAPLFDIGLLGFLAALGLGVFAAATYYRVRMRTRLIALGLFALFIAAPQLLRWEVRHLPDMLLAVVDSSSSASLGQRPQQIQTALTALKEAAAKKGISLQVRTPVLPQGSGTQLLTAVAREWDNLPQAQRAGIVLLSDGNWHDGAAKSLLKGVPVSTLLLGTRQENDRSITLNTTQRFGRVGKTLPVQLRVLASDLPPQTPVPITLWIHGRAQQRTVPAGEEVTLQIPLSFAGEMEVVAAIGAATGELSTANNRAVLQIEGIRDKLRVLLISGAPSPATRTWRSLLKSDQAVDLVHFTILRPPEKNDFTPREELALIPFPAEELFTARLQQFDVVIFDDYRLRHILSHQYLNNIVSMVRRGGALLFTGGMDGEDIAQSPLAELLPVLPAGADTVRPQQPVTLTALGKFHPVTRPFVETAMGDWQNILLGTPPALGSEVLLQTPDAQPLLVLHALDQRRGEGRVAQILAGRAWVWQRDITGGGPYVPLLRRTLHWLLKQPSLDETRPTASVLKDGRVQIERMVSPVPMTLSSPDGTVQPLRLMQPNSSIPLEQTTLSPFTTGIHLIEAGDQLLAVPSLHYDALEEQQVLANPDAATALGTVISLAEHPTPRLVDIPLESRHAKEKEAARAVPLLPPPLILLILAGMCIFIWRREAR